MELIEREEFLDRLQSKLKEVSEGEGHCVFVSGEAGIGKTSLVKTFCKELQTRCAIFQGTCDALFTPRPLAPLYDILLQNGSNLPENTPNIADRTLFFTRVFNEFKSQKETCLVIFEDIHWADDATFDFIKFFARRITQLRCLFVLTYRDTEVHANEHLKGILAHLNRDSFTRFELPPLSKQAVDKLSCEKGYRGEDVYSVAGGNPFYVNEILANYSPGIPDNIRDSVLSVFNRLDDKTKHAWKILSVLPAPFEIDYLKRMDPSFSSVIENCINHRILVLNDGLIAFKHELYRRTIEASLSPLVKAELNRTILDLLLPNFENNQKIEQIVHHAKNAHEFDLVVQYAPIAGAKAASVGAHTEAAKLFLSAIEYYKGNDPFKLIEFYEAYAYECYLTNQIKTSIIYADKTLSLWEKINDAEKIGNCLRILSRLWWFDGNRKKAESFATRSIEVLDKLPTSKSKAMAYSNMSHLKMLSDEPAECILWGEKAIAMAKELSDDEILSHALNNVGDVQARIPSSKEIGIGLLEQSLQIALKNGFQEHAARAYTNLVHNGMLTKDYEFARSVLEKGLSYCEECGLDSWSVYILSNKARLKLETGEWDEAFKIARRIINVEEPSAIVRIGVLVVYATIKMRRGEGDALPLLVEANELAFKTMELHRIVPAMVASLEYEWITSKNFIADDALATTIGMTGKMGNIYENSAFAFWLKKARSQVVSMNEVFEGYKFDDNTTRSTAVDTWKKAGCPYEVALSLFEGSDDDKRKAVSMMQDLGATAVYEKMKFDLRKAGVKKIPRGARKTTQSNAAQLTSRELEILQLINAGLQNKEIASKLFISAKTVDHHITSILYKLEVNSRAKAVHEAIRLEIIK